MIGTNNGRSPPDHSRVSEPSVRPAIALFLLAPFMAEVLSGSTPPSAIYGLVFFVPMYGGGALLIREVVRRQHRGWPSMVVLGLAFALIEEGLAVQAIFNPAIVEAARWGIQAGGLIGGVYGVFTVTVVAYHAIWSICAPILIVETAFPRMGTKPYLGDRGTAITAGIYTLGVLLVAVIVRTEIAPDYRAPLHLLIGTGIVVCGLTLVALRWPRTNPVASKDALPAPRPLLVGVLVSLCGTGFLGVLVLPARLDMAQTDGLWVLLSLVAAALLATLAILLLRTWSARSGWGSWHKAAVAIGLIVSNGTTTLIQGHLQGVDLAVFLIMFALSCVVVALIPRRVNRLASGAETD